MDNNQFVAVLDACVLYPAPIRDILLSLAAEGLFIPKWTNHIQNEWVRNLLFNRKDLQMEQLAKTVMAMNNAFPNANTYNYELLIPDLNLPDKNDRHVLACAIKAKADIIITFNKKDFPEKIVKEFNVKILNPDIFISHIIDSDKGLACLAFNKMIQRLKNPPLQKAEVFKLLNSLKLSESINKLERYC